MEFPLFNEADQKDLFQALNKTEVKKMLNNTMIDVVFLTL